MPPECRGIRPREWCRKEAIFDELLGDCGNPAIWPTLNDICPGHIRDELLLIVRVEHVYLKHGAAPADFQRNQPYGTLFCSMQLTHITADSQNTAGTGHFSTRQDTNLGRSENTNALFCARTDNLELR